jgi:hypothetical protein
MSEEVLSAIARAAMADEMRALLECLGESPDALAGAGIVLAHLGHFVFENIHEWAHQNYPDRAHRVMVQMTEVWMRSAVEMLEPLLPPEAHPL